MMSDDTELPDSLARAIGQFREELLLWLDTELTWLRERERAESRVMAEETTAATSIPAGLRGGSPLDSRTGREAACTARPELASRIGFETLRDRERTGDWDPVPETAGPPLASPGAETDPRPPAPPLSPRQRLDALARVLDHRLKQTQGAAGPNRGPAPSGKVE